jgi:FAD-dependent urate hydroxylase
VDVHTKLLIVGAGPFGMATASLAGDRGIDHLLIGSQMAFWREHMPAGMYLRSAADWHLDPAGVCTIERFLDTLGLTRLDAEPLSLQRYLEYTDWFQAQKGLHPVDDRVTALHHVEGTRAAFRAEMASGALVIAEAVLLALGFGCFAHAPGELVSKLPAGRWTHTCDFVALEHSSGRRCLVLGGRQSAFEWAALLSEAGAASVHVVHRHETPRFAEADWSWVGPLVERFEDEPGWYRRLSKGEREALDYRLWCEGRLKIEPWLEPRCRGGRITVWPSTKVVSAREGPGDAVTVRFDNGRVAAFEQIILATGYKADLTRVPFLTRGNLLRLVATDNGRPLLDDTLQTTLAGLFVTSLLAGHDFGPFFGFTVSARTSARLVIRGLGERGIAPPADA